MRRLQLACRALVACLALLVVAGPAGGGEAPAPRQLDAQPIAAAGANRAAVIVDTGDGAPPRRICIRFDANSISGEEALRLAAAQDASLSPQFADYGGMGKAVCQMCGIGGSGGDCFADPTKFWAYHQAAPGAGSFRQSPVGVTQTRVTDGSVEGYRYGSGTAPALVDIQTVCGEVPAPTTTAAPSPPPTPAPAPPTTSPPPAPATGGAPADRRPGGSAEQPAPDPSAPEAVAGAPATGAAPPADASTSVTTATTITTTAPEAATGAAATGTDGDGGTSQPAGDQEEIAAVRVDPDDDGGGSPLALAGVGVVAVAMVGVAVALRRARARDAAGGA